MSSRWDQSSETVPLAQYKILEEKYDNLAIEHENLIKTLEVIEETNGLTVDDLGRPQRKLLVTDEDYDELMNVFGEMKKTLEVYSKDLGYLMSSEETNMNGIDSGSAGLAEKPNVKNNNNNNNKNVSKEDVIVISDDEEENQTVIKT